MPKLLSLLFFLSTSPLFGQFSYTLDQNVLVTDNNTILRNAWAGGLNASQFSTIDLNNDGKEDLVVFDRTSSSLFPFLNIENEYVFAPKYRAKFPDDITNWMLLRDYNCDGKKDLFASEPRGMVVYENITGVDGELEWRIFNYRAEQNFKHLLTQGFNSAINLQVNGSDIPAIDDIDGDGDLDILVYRFSGASTIEFHQNMSMDLSGNCDSLQFVRSSQKWGDFEECECGQFAFNNTDCPTGSGGRVEHQGGKSILPLDINNNGVKDLIVSEESCSDLFLLNNGGTVENALLDNSTNQFPNTTNPAQFFIFPAAFSEDLDSDGLKDIVVAPNVPANVSNSVNFQSSNWFYKNTGTPSAPSYTLIQKNFLQDKMIDVGENAAPAFADIDADGDLDMIVGNYVNLEENGFRSTLILYKNTGTASDPEFQKESEDYLTFSDRGYYNLKPQFHDINNDNRLDLIYSATEINTGLSRIYYLLNQSGGIFNFDQNEVVLFTYPSAGATSENFYLYDIGQDGLLDILIGKSSGKIEYHKNIGNNTMPDFQLIDDTFYGFDPSPFRQNPSLYIEDLNADNQPDMLIGDSRGNLTIYNNFLSTIDNPEPGTIDFIANDGENKKTTYKSGSRLLPSVVNLFNENKPAIVIGTGAGGLTLLRHTETENNPELPNANNLQIYPVPASQNDLLNINVNERMSIAIISITGQTILKGISIDANSNHELSLSNFKSGIYMVVAKSPTQLIVKRFVVIE